jgi:LemA protein
MKYLHYSDLLAMSTMNIVLIILCILLVLVFLVVIWIIGLYNKLVRSRNRYKKAFADIDVQLKRRHDLIPNLVETAKAFMSHERETLEAVIAARNIASNARARANLSNASSIGSLAQAESGLGGALSRLMMVTEAYPDLKADKTMGQLSEELTHTENKVSFSRQAYNGAVTDYNDYRETFPTSIFANMFNFSEAILFEVSDASEREAVKVKF